jgi:nitrite reductase/ring-hydroxylating ferredoxin subunit
VFGYVNSCPHLGTPLNWAGDTFISEDSGLIICATHGALFEIEDGACVSGPCAGQSLEAAPVTVDRAGQVVLTGD